VPPGPLNLQRLRYFVTVAELGHVSRAAAAHHITQQAMSDQVRRLESELQVRLFDRTAKGVRLSPAGQVLAAGARSLLSDADRLRARVRAAAAPEAPLQVAVATGARGGWLVNEAAARLRTEHPDLRLQVRHILAGQLESLRDGEADLLVAFLPFSDEELEGVEVHPVAEEPRAVYLWPGHPLAGRDSLTVDDVADETWFDRPVPPDFSPTWIDYWTLRRERAGRGRTAESPVHSFEDLAAAIGRGEGVAVSTFADRDFYRRPDLVAVRLRDLPPATVAVLHLAEHRPPLLEELVAEIRHREPEAVDSSR
jgi:DNA-binding transcriptional LysR family regulator